MSQSHNFTKPYKENESKYAIEGRPSLSDNKSLPNNFSEQQAIGSAKEVNDRSNVIIAANSFLLLPFVNCLTSTLINGYLNAIPILICIVGIGLNIFLIGINRKQLSKISDYKIKLNQFLKEKYSVLNFPTIDIEDVSKRFNTYAPIFLIIIWVLCMAFVIVQKTVGIS